MPLTPTWKIDRRALARAGPTRPDVGSAFVALRTAVERRLTKIRADLLRLDLVGVLDDLFDLGGRLLLSRIGNGLRVALSLIGQFETTTVEEQAKIVERVRQGAAAGRTGSPMPPGDSE